MIYQRFTDSAFARMNIQLFRNGRTLLVCLLALPMLSLAQKNTDPDKATTLRGRYQKDPLVAYAYTSDYRFQLAKDRLVVVESDVIGMIALEGNVNYSREVYYDDNTSIASAEVSYTSGKRMNAQKTCGNFEVENVFYSDAKVCSYAMNFLHQGTEITFKSEKHIDDPRYLTKVFFHDALPVENRTITFSVPHSATVELVEKNFAGFDITRNVEETAKGKRYTYAAKNIHAIKNEANSLGMLYYYPHIVVVTKDYTSDAGKTTVIGSVDELYKWYSTIVHDVNNDPAVFKGEVARLTASASTTEDKIKAIYYWVQDNIKYIAFEDGIAGFKPAAAQDVYHNRYGDCKGMANLTKEMLRVAGIDARLTWIGTNRIPYTYDLPSLAVNNHMICTAIVGEREYILDPTEKFIALGMFGERIQGKEMLIENGDQYFLRQVPVSSAAQNLIVRNENLTLEGEQLKGQGKIMIHGEAMKNILYVSANSKEENRKKLLDNLVIPAYTNSDRVEVTNSPSIDREEVLTVAYTYRLTNKVTRFEDDVYIDIDWSKTFKDLHIDPDRVSDYYFNRKIKNRITKNLTVPAGYKVSHLPSGIVKQHDDFSILVKFEQKGDVLSYTNEIIVPRGIVRKADFGTWNTFIAELNSVYDDQIVLTKRK